MRQDLKCHPIEISQICISYLRLQHEKGPEEIARSSKITTLRTYSQCCLAIEGLSPNTFHVRSFAYSDKENKLHFSYRDPHRLNRMYVSIQLKKNQLKSSGLQEAKYFEDQRAHLKLSLATQWTDRPVALIKLKILCWPTQSLAHSPSFHTLSVLLSNICIWTLILMELIPGNHFTVTASSTDRQRSTISVCVALYSLKGCSTQNKN